MGLNHSLCAIVPRAKADAATAALLQVLAPSSRLLLEGGGLLALAASVNQADSGPHCLALMIQLEPEFAVQFDDEPPPCLEAAGEFGCLWATVRAGVEYLLVELAAATTGMSVVLQQSARVHALWRDVALASGALLAYVDLEDGAALGLYPREEYFALPKVAQGGVFNVDTWCAACIREHAPVARMNADQDHSVTRSRSP